MNRKFSILLFVLVLSIAKAQLPDTDVWLFKLEKTKKELKLTDPKNISKRPGYDNQPSFSNDSKKIYYVSIREDKQADIYVYDIGNEKTIQLTKTKESEYSPVLTPDAKCLNSVVVESDSAQRIHFINSLTGISDKKFEVDSVGYYTFLNNDTVLYYKLTSPHSLRYYVKSTNEDKWLGNNPTRTFKTLNRHAFIYGVKDSVKVTFYKYDFVFQKAEKYAEYLSTSEDAVWHEQHGLLKSEGNKILRYEETKKEWITFFDLSSFGIKKITRFNFDPKNKFLVIVDNL
ncbi:MAG: PD40 domain-containing protein [Bacteroidetes bacterium]|nr:PD40 domain-containing protein [Bacteroidota bacterium]